jgi:hypothetical protein
MPQEQRDLIVRRGEDLRWHELVLAPLIEQT